MQILARQGLLDAQVRAALVRVGRVVTWGVDLLDLSGAWVEDISGSVTACTVHRQMYRPVHGAVDFTVTKELDWPNRRVRPWQAVDGIRFNLGTFGMEIPEKAAATGTFTVIGFDALFEFQRRIIGDTHNVASGVGYLAAARQAVTDSGVTGVAPLFDSASEATTTPGPLVWLFDAKAPYSWMRPINDLLAAINYRGAWIDELGDLRSVPYRTPAERGDEWTFDSTDLEADIVLPERSVTTDNRAATTAWMFLRNGMTTEPTEGAGIYYAPSKTAWDDDAAIRAVYAFDAADQASLEAQGDRQVQVDTSRTRLLDVTTGPFPCAGHFDVYRVIDPVLGSFRVQGRSWDQDLVARTVKHTWEVVDDATV